MKQKKFIVQEDCDDCFESNKITDERNEGY